MADNAFDQANLAFDQANTAYSLAQTALIQANTAAGSNKQVQFNDDGILAGNTFFTYDKSTGTLTVKNISVEDDINVVNNLNINGDIVPSELGQNIGLPNQRWYNFYIDGGIYANGTFGNPGQVLSTDGYGIVRWIDLPSANVDGNTIIYAIDQVARSTANNAEELAQAAFNKANTVVSTSIDQYARNTANVAYNNSLVSQAVDNTQNTNITRADTKAQAAFDKANTSYVLAETSNTTATSAVTIAQNAYNKANTASTSAIDQYARNYANVAFYNTEVLAGVDLTQNTQIQSLNTQVQYASATANSAKNDAASASLYANNGITLAQAAFNKANSITVGVDQYARDTANTATTNIAVQTGVNLTQNTNITRADTKAQAAFDKANTNASNITVVGNYANSGITLAQAAFDKANTGTGTFGVDQYARDTANTSLSTTAYLQNVNDSQNTTITNLTTFAQAAYNQANTQSVAGTTANLAYAKANSANVLAQAAYNQANTATNIATSASVYANTGINNAASASLYANTAINNANSAGQYANSALNLAQNAYDFANTLSGGTATDGWARQRANNAYNQANSATNAAATASLYALQGINDAASASLYANTAISNAESASLYANTGINNAASASLYANVAIQNAATAQDDATYGIGLAQAAFDSSNTKYSTSGGTINGNVNITGNLVVSGETFYANVQHLNVEDNIITLNSNVTGAPTTNAGIEINRGTEPNTSLIWNEFTKEWQYTNDGVEFKTIADNANVQSTLDLAQSAFNFANLLAIGASTDTYARETSNAAYAQANAAFTLANNIVVVGNVIPLGVNTQGQLVSNAVTLTTTSSVTNSLALINQVLGKLVPAGPPNFPNSNTLTIGGTVGPYRMTNFTQTDNTLSGGKSISGGTTVAPRRASAYYTNTLNDMGPGESGVLSVIKNGINSGNIILTSVSSNGTFGDLVVSDSVDYSTKTGSAPGFWRSFDVQASGTVASGWNEVYISHTSAANTPAVSWYYDSSNPGTPTFANASIAPISESLTYSSGIPHYNNSTIFGLSVDVSKLSGDTFPVSNTFFTGTSGGAFQAPASNTYSGVGISYPLPRNLYVSSGSVKVNTTVAITASAFGSSSIGPTVTVDNSYSTGSLSFTPILAKTVLYKNGTTSTMEETSLRIGSPIGVGSGSASRIINPGNTDTPVLTSGAALFNSQASTLQTYDATIVAGILKHDQTNYSTGYLPSGPNLSTGRSGNQYLTFKFTRTSVSKFDIQFSGTIAGLWVALPGSTIDSTSTLNGWIDMSVDYAGSGVPGAGAGGNGSNGCALGGTVTLNSNVTKHRKTCTFGTVSSSSTATNEIYVRIKLTSGQSVSALSLQTASN